MAASVMDNRYSNCWKKKTLNRSVLLNVTFEIFAMNILRDYRWGQKFILEIHSTRMVNTLYIPLV